ncbi:hypothetical protein Adt_20103 [Abeliophyllum distichum]|uniref:Uncharacterized protein n=1 Tax=Abeliophyllum distichum TaxID=126358 RepID=A0ABD1SUU4_9LAMI
MHSPAFKCVCEWDAFASAPDVQKDSEGLWPGSDSGCPKWMESNGGGHVFVVLALIRHGNASVCVPNHLPAEEVVEEEGQGGGSGVGRRLRPTLARLSKQRPKVLVPGSAKDTSQRKVIEDLSQEGNKAEVAAPDIVEIEDTGVPEGEVHLKKKRKDRASRSGPSQSKKKVELVDNYTVCAPQPLQRTLSVNPSGEVVLDSPPRADPVYEGSRVGPFDSKKKLRELIGPPGLRISDDTLRNVSFFPSMGAQAVKKYLTPKWDEFASHGELEDMLEAGLAVAVRATSLQIKVLGEFQTRMQEHKKLIAEASKSNKEH